MPTRIADIIQGLRADRAPNDRRRSPRVGLRARVAICLPRAGRLLLPAWMRDVSAGGAGLLLSRAVRADEQVLLQIPLSRQAATKVRARVVHCAKVGAFFRVGLEFLEKGWQQDRSKAATADPVQALGQHLRRFGQTPLD